MKTMMVLTTLCLATGGLLGADLPVAFGPYAQGTTRVQATDHNGAIRYSAKHAGSGVRAAGKSTVATAKKSPHAVKVSAQYLWVDRAALNAAKGVKTTGKTAGHGLRKLGYLLY